MCVTDLYTIKFKSVVYVHRAIAFSTYLLCREICFRPYFSGDYLSFRNGKSAQATQGDGLSPTKRLEGLIMGLSDFHAMMNLLDIIYKSCFSVSMLTVSVRDTRRVTVNLSDFVSVNYPPTLYTKSIHRHSFCAIFAGLGT